VFSATAHLEIHVVVGPSAKISPADEKLDKGDKSIILGRTSVSKGSQEGRDPNKPNPGDVCHGLPMLTGSRLAILTAGGEFQWGIKEEKYGSGHDGGHCSWWVSDGTDQNTWFKFMDDLDCTNNVKFGTQPGKVKIPENLPINCKTGCTIMWLWSPLHAGNCEIYSNCFDVRIQGVKGGIKDAGYPTKTPPYDCIRVNPETHKTSAFGKYINVATDGKVTFETVVDGNQDCYQYIVRENDALQKVLAKFDFSADKLYQRNKKIMSGPDTLPAPGTKLTIAGCEEKKPCPPGIACQAGSISLSFLIALGAISLLF